MRNLRTVELDIPGRFGSADFQPTPTLDIGLAADGAFMTYIVSPRDLSNFILPEFEEIRIGVPAARLDWYFGPAFSAQAILVPRFVPNRMPDQDSLWRPALSWELDDGVEAGLSADLFFGDEDGRFGYYAGNDLLTAEVAFRF